MAARQPRPFLLGSAGVDENWLNDWPIGGVALIVGGSVDMRSVRKMVKKDLKDKEIQLFMLHATLWGGRRRPQGKYLLLATETLFSQKYQGICNQLWVVFDMCEKHILLQPPPTSEEMRWLRQFGRCDVLLTVSITPEEQARRKRLLGTRYRPKEEVRAPSQATTNWLNWLLSSHEIWQLAGSSCLFVGFPLPDIHLNDQFWDHLFGWSTERSHFKARTGGEWVSFNSLPLNFLLEAVIDPRLGESDRFKLSLAVCAVQLISSRAFAPIFQHKRALMFDHQTVWDVTETSVFMCLFLSAGGRWSKEATLVHLALQHLQQHGVDQLENLEGQTFAYYTPSWNADMRRRFGLLLEEMMLLLQEFHQSLTTELQIWCPKFCDRKCPPNRLPGELPLGFDIGTFLENKMRDAAIAASSVGAEPAFEFVFPLGSSWELRSSRFHQSPHDRSPQIHVQKERYTSALQKVLRCHFDSAEYQVSWNGDAVFPVHPDSWQGDRLVASALFLNLLLDHDDDLDEEDRMQWQLRTWHTHEVPEKVFAFRHGQSWNNVQFATVPLKLYAADSKPFFEGKSIYVLKRFATPDLLVLSSVVVCRPPPYSIEDGWRGGERSRVF